jgi:aminoglycoside phosphotransferase (APT) family kinase protein
VDNQFPRWRSLPLRRWEQPGSDHVIYRLGDELAVRFPRHAGAIGQARTELKWLPRLAPHLPLAIPEPVAVGEPALGYPWAWAVARWLPGTVATVDELGDSRAVARTLAAFVLALQAFPEVTTPTGGSGLPERDDATRAAIAAVAGDFDAKGLLAVWDEALAAPGWNRPPVWFHGDFHTGNLLTVGGRLSAVIDFGGLGFGDPARDLMMPFSLMTARARAAFRDELRVDDATWARGRGWALTGGVIAHRAYAKTNPRVRAATTRQLHGVLDISS